MRILALGVALLSALTPPGSAGPAVDLGKLERSIAREPAYRTKAPRYCLLVFGPEAKTRVWLVRDGDTLYVDRNGNGDLTEPGEKVAAKKDPDRDSEAFGHTFEAGEVQDGQRRHQHLFVHALPLSGRPRSFRELPDAKAALSRDPKAGVYSVSVSVESPGLKGHGEGGRLYQSTGYRDGNGVLLFADRPQDAPVIHFGGPLRITLGGARPFVRLRRDSDLSLEVGTPGAGNGTFAAVGFEGLMPAEAHPKVEIHFPPAKRGDPPVKATYELKQRC
jgi:hypothetical protein